MLRNLRLIALARQDFFVGTVGTLLSVLSDLPDVASHRSQQLRQTRKHCFSCQMEHRSNRQVLHAGEEGRRLVTPPSQQTYEGGSRPQRSADDSFVCNVCLDPVQDPVVTQCGHLYCWPCLFRWLKTHHTTCPVCKASVTKENVIPIFLGGSDQDPRAGDLGTAAAGGDVPNRPQGQRPEPPEPAMGGQAFGGGGGLTYTGNFGFFPSLFGLQFQEFVPQPTRNRAVLSASEQHEQFLYKVLIAMGSVVFICFVAF